MNITYPLVLDAGEGIKSLGDPRIVARRCRWSSSWAVMAASRTITSAITKSTAKKG